MSMLLLEPPIFHIKDVLDEAELSRCYIVLPYRPVAVPGHWQSHGTLSVWP